MQTGFFSHCLWLLTRIGLALGLSQAMPLHAIPVNDSSLIVRAARVLDVRAGVYRHAAAIWVKQQRIQAVGEADQIVRMAPAHTPVIDLGDATILPGLIDCHTHLLARIPEEDDGYARNLLTKSQAYRALEGAASARASLEAGFTTVRDVENEGAGYADVALRDAIDAGLVEGPRMQVATRGIAAVGQYHPFAVSPDLTDFPTGAQLISGTTDARRAVREQIAHGADLIKIYADWRYPTLTLAEMRVIVDEAHKANRHVAAHATTVAGIHHAILAGVDSIEHGNNADRATLEMMKAKGIYLVPTLSALDARIAGATDNQRATLQPVLAAKNHMVSLARELGVKLASGSDPASAVRQGRNARELESMTQRGLSPLEAIRAATLAAADLLGWSNDIGSLEPGKYADIIAVRGDPLVDITLLQQVQFVMQGGRVIKHHVPS